MFKDAGRPGPITTPLELCCGELLLPPRHLRRIRMHDPGLDDPTLMITVRHSLGAGLRHRGWRKGWRVDGRVGLAASTIRLGGELEQGDDASSARLLALVVLLGWAAPPASSVCVLFVSCFVEEGASRLAGGEGKGRRAGEHASNWGAGGGKESGAGSGEWGAISGHGVWGFLLY